MRTALVLLPAPRVAAELACVAELAAAWADDRRPVVLAELPKAAANGAREPATLLCLSGGSKFDPEASVGRALATLASGGILAIDAWPAPDGLPTTLRTIARCVFSMATPPAACVIFAPPAERFYAAEQLAGAFRLRVAGSELFRRDVAQALAAARWLRWLGPAGLPVHRLIARSRSRVRRLLAG